MKSNKEPEWEKFTGVYEKKFYDIRLYKEVIHNCYPNAGTFHTPDGQVIEDKYVRYIKPSAKEKGTIRKTDTCFD